MSCRIPLVASVLILTVSACQEAPTPPRPVEPVVVAIGKPAPEIDGADQDGVRFKLSAHRGKVVLLSFWFSTCPPCRKLMPHERALAKRHKNDPFVLLGVNADESLAELKKTIDNEGLTWRNWWDSNGRIQSDYRIEGFPTTIVIDPNGLIVDITVGLPARERDLDDAISMALQKARSGS